MNTIKYRLLLALSLLPTTVYCGSSLKSFLKSAAKTWGIKHALKHKKETGLTLAGATALYVSYSAANRYSPLFRNYVSAPLNFNLKRYMRNLRQGDKRTLIGTGVAVGAAAGAYYYRNELSDFAQRLINRFNSTSSDDGSFREPNHSASTGSNNENSSGSGSSDEIDDNGLIAEAARLKETLQNALGTLSESRGAVLGTMQTLRDTRAYPDLDPDFIAAAGRLHELNDQIAEYENALRSFDN